MKLIPANTPNKYLYIIILTVVLGGLVNIGVTILILSLLLSYVIVRHLIDKSVFNSWLLVSILSVFFYVVIMQCVILCVWLVNRNFPLDTTIYITLIVLGIIYTHMRLTKQNVDLKKVRTPPLHIHDILSLVVGLLILAVVILPPQIKNGWGEKSNILTYVNASIDDGHHVELLNDRLQFNRGVIYHSDATNSVRTSGSISAYPVGWHAVNAVIIKSFYPKVSTGVESITAYVLTKLFWYTILVLLFVRVSFIAFGFLYIKRGTALANTWITLASTLLAFFFLIAPFRQGFYSFIPQLIAALLLSVTLLQIVKSKNDDARIKSIVLASVVCIGGSLPWILLLPAFALSLLLVLILTSHKGSYIKDATRYTYVCVRKYPFIYLLLLSALSLQLYLMAASETSISFIESITIQGPIEVYSGEFYLVIFIGLAILITLYNKKSAKYLRTLLILLGSILLITAFIGIIQFYKLYDYTYYYFKSLNVFTVVAIPIALAGYGLALQYIYKKDRALSYISIFFILLILIQFVGPNPGYPNGLIGQNTHGKLGRELIDYTKVHRPIPSPVNKHVYASLLEFQNSYFTKTIPIYYSQGLVSQNEVASLMLKTNIPASDCVHKIHGSIYKSETIHMLLNYINKSCSPDYLVNIYTDKEQVQQSQGAVEQLGLKNVRILSN